MVTYLKKVSAFIAISLATMVISLATNAGAATIPTITARPLWTPVPGFGAVITKMAVDAAGNIYVADHTQKAIVKLNSAGSYVGRISTSSIGNPFGVAVLKNSNIVVTFQTPAKKIVMYDQAGTVISTGTDLANAQLQEPSAVTVDGLDNIYVLDSGEMHGAVVVDGSNQAWLQNSYPSIHVFNKNGSKYITTPYIGVRPSGYADNSFGEASRLDPFSAIDGKGFGLLVPEGLAYDSVNKRILVADTGNSRIIAFGSADSATPFVQLTKTGEPTVPLSWGTAGDVNSDSTTAHLGAPVGVALEASAGRLYVVDKALKRVKVLDYSNGAFLKTIDEGGYPAASFTLPKDIIYYKGNLLVSSEKGKNASNLQTLSINSSAWPPASIQIYLDAYPHNIVKQVNDRFIFTGKVDTGSTLSYINNGNSGACVIPNPVGYGLESFYCDVQLDVTGGTAGTEQNLIITANKNGSDQSVSADVIYTTSSTLLSAPVLVSNPFSQLFTNSATVSVTGTIDISSTGATSGQMVQIKNLKNNNISYATVNTSDVGNVKSWSSDLNLDEGLNNLEITGWADMTQIATAASQSITLDTVKPNVTIAFIADGGTTTKAVLNISGIAVDANLDKVSVSLNGIQLQQESIKVDPVTGYFSSVLQLTNNNTNTVAVSAADKAGNIDSSSRTVSLEPMKAAPLVVNQPADNIFISGNLSSLDYSGTTDSATTAVKVGLDPQINAPGTSWLRTSTRYIGTDDQLEVVDIIAELPTGQLNEVRSIYKRQSSPGVIVQNPSSDISTKSNSIFPVSGSYELSSVTSSPINTIIAELLDSTNSIVQRPAVTINSTLKTYSLDVDFNGIQEGRYSLKLTVTDLSGATAIATRNFIVDRSAPKLGLCVDSTNPNYLYGAVEAGAVVSASDLRPVTLSGNIWSVSKAGIDLQTFSASASDMAGNITTSSYPSASNPYDGDMDGDGIVRVYDAVIALRAVANTPSANQVAHGDVSVKGFAAPGLSCPDGEITLEDVQLILAKASGIVWQ